jgi:hypothetical protein
MKNDLPAIHTEDKASSMAMMLSPERMNSAMSLAKVMASSTVTVPKHLQGKEGDCMAIILQSMNWGMNPFAVAQKTHLVNGVLGYEAQLVNAVVQSQGFIDGTFHYEYQGEGATLQCRVGAVIRGESQITWGEWLKKSDVTVQNSPLWKTNPKQQLGYLQVKNWTRLYFPAAILGVYSVEELQDMPAPAERDVTAESTREEPAIVYYTDEEFEAKSKEWQGIVESLRKSADGLIATVESRGKKFTDAQKKAITGWEPSNVIDVQATNVTDDFVAAMESTETQGA